MSEPAANIIRRLSWSKEYSLSPFGRSPRHELCFCADNGALCDRTPLALIVNEVAS